MGCTKTFLCQNFRSHQKDSGDIQNRMIRTVQNMCSITQLYYTFHYAVFVKSNALLSCLLSKMAPLYGWKIKADIFDYLFQ